MAFDRVAGNKGANTPGVDGITAAWVEQKVGVPGFLEDLRAALKDGSFAPLPVRERLIPKPAVGEAPQAGHTHGTRKLPGRAGIVRFRNRLSR